jgi:hypothetical protein
MAKAILVVTTLKVRKKELSGFYQLVVPPLWAVTSKNVINAIIMVNHSTRAAIDIAPAVSKRTNCDGWINVCRSFYL